MLHSNIWVIIIHEYFVCLEQIILHVRSRDEGLVDVPSNVSLGCEARGVHLNITSKTLEAHEAPRDLDFRLQKIKGCGHVGRVGIIPRRCSQIDEVSKQQRKQRRVLIARLDTSHALDDFIVKKHRTNQAFSRYRWKIRQSTMCLKSTVGQINSCTLTRTKGNQIVGTGIRHGRSTKSDVCPGAQVPENAVCMVRESP